MTKQVLAAFDEEGVYVYQAFKPSIVEAALKHDAFAEGFNLERMTWIKPSFGWMLYRSDYATKHRQERILKIKLRHEGFRKILGRSVPTTYDPKLFPSAEEWGLALRRADVRYQWDPDRDLRLIRLERRNPTRPFRRNGGGVCARVDHRAGGRDILGPRGKNVH